MEQQGIVGGEVPSLGEHGKGGGVNLRYSDGWENVQVSEKGCIGQQVLEKGGIGQRVSEKGGIGQQVLGEGGHRTAGV